MDVDFTGERWAFVSTEPAGRREIRFALVAVVISVLIFVAASPVARIPLLQVPAFIPMYVASLVICDLITAALLFGQFSVLRSPGLLILAGGYFFSATATFAYALFFPGLLMLPGLPVPGPQTSSAMYMFWHSGFPLFIVAYTGLKFTGPMAARSGGRLRGSVRLTVFYVVVGVLVAVGCFSLFATLGHSALPVFIEGNRTSDVGRLVLCGIWLLSLVALWMLWRRKPHTVLDLWLLVVMSVWLFDIALAALLNTGRYDLGWYVGRIYGLLAASFLLMVLLVENGRQYARLVHMSVELGAANKALAQLSRHDGLTELPNRRFFDEYLDEQVALSIRTKRPLALVLCDVDHFKTYNDHYGHQAGDECLRQVALALQSCSKRPTDMAARYGGEEFAMVLPDTDLAGAMQVAETVRVAVAELQIPHARSTSGRYVSVSAGVAVLRLDQDMTVRQLIVAADQWLYQAKGAGRNRVMGAPIAQ